MSSHITYNNVTVVLFLMPALKELSFLDLLGIVMVVRLI